MPPDHLQNRSRAHSADASPLTTEQITFAEILGAALAQYWHTQQRASQRGARSPLCRARGDSDVPQGQRILTLCSGKDLEHVFVVPTTGPAFHGHAVFVGMLLQQGQRETIQPSKVLAEMLITDA
jgi:hypothetical protein